MKDYSKAPLALANRIVSNNLVHVKHVFGEPCGWIITELENGDRRHRPDYSTRVHDLYIPINDIQVRTHANGRPYLCYNPLYHLGRKDNSTWNIIRCEGGEMDVVIDINQDHEEPITMHMTGRDTPIIIPGGARQYKFTMRGCADIINAGEQPRLKSIDCADLVMLENIKVSYDVKDYGNLATAQKNVMPQWSY
uniref:Uncharacterized protein n=1 Tax=Pseudomonas phage RVTF4 TaxID=3236931 RepID=A0AB39CCS5_9VIRU